ncbi:hypothetical protein PGT21_011565 [Puccinia graminis f. sp. tritici]|uniref:Uncharacterized protein n=1 Tax=Puccinia graminis f. sp. tritici TaxID=56615 RepID=A0A5B0MW52_PUCGR|nr:hypothetical protein PGT21_011565 [Puccinia graminis f. sp. tritici]
MGQPNIILTHPTQVRDEQTNDVGRLSPPEMIVSLTSSQATVPHTQSANEGLFEGASQRCRLVKPLSNPTAGFDASLLSKDQPTAGLYAKPMLEDMPTMASNTSRYETLVDQHLWCITGTIRETWTSDNEAVKIFTV